MKFILWFSILLLPFIGVSQKYAFVTYSTEDGLPQTQVTSICQDKDGYLWIATLGGLAKFNGGQFTTFSSNDGLLNNRIQTLFYEDNTLWVGHDGGISYIRGNKIRSVGFSGNDKSRNVSQIIKFKNRMVVCTNGSGLFELKNDQFKAIQLPDDDSKGIRMAYTDGDTLYLATRGGIYKSHDLKKFVLESKVVRDSYYGVVGNKNEIYFISFDDGVYKKNRKTGKISHIDRTVITNTLRGGYLDKDGTLWLHSDNGIIRYKNGNVTLLDDASGLQISSMVSCFFEDESGNFWIGSLGKGMFRFPGEVFKYYNRSTGYQSDIFLSGFESANGEFYLGTLDQGLLKRNRKGEIVSIDIGERIVWAAQPNVGGLHWFGTQTTLVSLDASDNVTIYSGVDGLPGEKITAFYKVGPNEMYIGGNGGVSHYKNGVFTYLHQPGTEEIGTVRDFVIQNGVLYCATNLGIFKYKNKKFEVLPKVQDVTYNMEIDYASNIWFGTEEGLYRISKGKLERIELRVNPASNFINFMNYRNGLLYVGTNNGLFILSDLEKEKPTILRFGTGEGLVDLETNLNSGFFDSEGNFWFGTASGLVCYYPNAERIIGAPPKIQLKSILLNYLPFDYSVYGGELNASGIPDHLSLPYSKNNLIFELDGISMSHHRGLNYQFMLEGLSDTWSPITSNPTITFTSLPAGEYRLRMRTVDMDGRHSKEIIVPFTINQAYYKTWWFITLCVLGVFGIVLLYFRFRVRRINEANEKERLEFKARLLTLEQQSMNASMNRHFVFNSLNSIQYFINTHDRVSANKYLTSFAQLIRKNLDSATADGNVITLEEELERLSLYLSLESMRFKDRFDYEINAEGIDTEAIRIPAMIMQPFVENSIIHGILPNLDKKGKITVDVTIEGDYLLLSLEDNGVGVNHSIAQKSLYEGDHRSKGMEITSKRIELLQKISEYDITLEGPYEVFNDDRSIKGTHVLLKMPVNYLDM